MSQTPCMRWVMVMLGMLGCWMGGGCMSGNPAHKLVWRTLAKGLVSGLTEPGRLVIRDEGEYLRTWMRHVSNLNRIGLPPAVDFSKEMVLVIAMGRRPTGGYVTDVVDVELRGRTLRVLVGERDPFLGSLQIQQVTEPFVFVALPAMVARVDFRTVREEGLGPGGRITRPGSEAAGGQARGGSPAAGAPSTGAEPSRPVIRTAPVQSPRGANR